MPDATYTYIYVYMQLINVDMHMYVTREIQVNFELTPHFCWLVLKWQENLHIHVT